MESQQEDKKETKTARVLGQFQKIANFLVPILLIVNLLLNFAMEQLPGLVTEKKHGYLGMHEEACGTFCIDKEEI